LPAVVQLMKKRGSLGLEGRQLGGPLLQLLLDDADLVGELGVALRHVVEHAQALDERVVRRRGQHELDRRSRSLDVRGADALVHLGLELRDLRPRIREPHRDAVELMLDLREGRLRVVDPLGRAVHLAFEPRELLAARPDPLLELRQMVLGLMEGVRLYSGAAEPNGVPEHTEREGRGREDRDPAEAGSKSHLGSIARRVAFLQWRRGNCVRARLEEPGGHAGTTAAARLPAPALRRQEDDENRSSMADPEATTATFVTSKG